MLFLWKMCSFLPIRFIRSPVLRPRPPANIFCWRSKHFRKIKAGCLISFLIGSVQTDILKYAWCQLKSSVLCHQTYNVFAVLQRKISLFYNHLLYKYHLMKNDIILYWRLNKWNHMTKFLCCSLSVTCDHFFSVFIL